jgi:2-keto-4-pentenoate hydratase
MNDRVVQLAADLHRQHRDRLPFRALACGPLACDLATAYAAQKSIVELSSARGATLAGYKVARLRAMPDSDSGVMADSVPAA